MSGGSTLIKLKGGTGGCILPPADPDNLVRLRGGRGAMAGLQMPGCLPLKLQMGKEETLRGPPSRKLKRNPPKPQQSWKVLSFFLSFFFFFNLHFI